MSKYKFCLENPKMTSNGSVEPLDSPLGFFNSFSWEVGSKFKESESYHVTTPHNPYHLTVGTIWLDVKDDTASQHDHQIVKDYGRFGYLEGHEYRMYLAKNVDILKF